MCALTELLGILGEGHGGAVVVGVHDPGLRVLPAKPLQLLLDHGVVALRELVVRFQAAHGVVVAAVLARMQRQVRRRAAHRQVPRHHQVHRAAFDQPLFHMYSQFLSVRFVLAINRKIGKGGCISELWSLNSR